MRHRTSVLGGVFVVALGFGGCGGSDSPATPLTPSPPPPQAVVPAPPASGFPPGHLTGVSLSGVVYELTPTGRRPISQAYVYCEACSEETHIFVLADDNGFYHFSGDLASGGGVWVTPGIPTDIAVGGSYNKDYEDPPGLSSVASGTRLERGTHRRGHQFRHRTGTTYSVISRPNWVPDLEPNPAALLA